MNKFNKSPGSSSGKKKPFKSGGRAFKKDRNSSEGAAKRSGEGYKGKSSYGSPGKEDGFKKKRPFNKEGEEKPYAKRSSKPFERKSDKGDFEKKPYKRRDDAGGEKRSFSKERSEGGYEKRPYTRKDIGDKEKRPYTRKSEGEATEEKSYKAKRSFTKNKEYRKSDTFKKSISRPFGKKKEFEGGVDRKKSFTKNDKYSDKSGPGNENKFSRFSEKPERFSKDKDFGVKKSFGRGASARKKSDQEGADIKRVKHGEFEEGKSFSKGYKKEFSREKGESRPKAKTAAADGLTRLNKYLANAGIASRREADTLIKSGVVKVNGVPVTEMGFKVKPGDTVTYGDAAVKSERKVYLLLNKPKDYITTTDDPQERNTVMDLVAGACRERVYPVGRLDRNTTGLLLLTNDGELTKKLTHPKHDIKKVYHVSLNKGLKPDDFKAIIEGVELEDGMIAADDLAFVGEGKKEIGIEIHSGRNRIVRRLFEHLGYEILKLDRVTFAGLTKKDLPRGKHRFLTAREVNFLQMIG